MTSFDPKQTSTASRSAMDEVKSILAQDGLSHGSLSKMRDVLLRLTARQELFPVTAFRPPLEGQHTNYLYCLAEDADGTNALYISAEHHTEDRSTLPHNHLTWAVIVGLEGNELNRLYERIDDGSISGRGSVRATSEVELKLGSGLFLMPDEIHSVHAKGGRTMLAMHMYGLSMPRQTERIEFLPDGTTRNRKPNPNVRPIPGL
jgi:predicted metal-dependent enzyme (double-stranded beta helix superfamily)